MLYVASFYGRVEIVSFVLSRGADKDLLCGGYRAVDVAAFVTQNPIQKVQIQKCFGGKQNVNES